MDGNIWCLPTLALLLLLNHGYLFLARCEVVHKQKQEVIFALCCVLIIQFTAISGWLIPTYSCCDISLTLTCLHSWFFFSFPNWIHFTYKYFENYGLRKKDWVPNKHTHTHTPDANNYNSCNDTNSRSRFLSNGKFSHSTVFFTCMCVCGTHIVFFISYECGLAVVHFSVVSFENRCEYWAIAYTGNTRRV